MGAHEHGHGHLNIVFDGNKVGIELQVPGMDLVGFEHAPSTPEQTAQLEAAKSTLETNLLELFAFPAAAACKVASAKVEVAEEGHEESHDDSAAEGAKEEEHHNEFKADYSLECADTTKVTTIEFPFFNQFRGAQELQVTIIDDGGQQVYEVTRDQARLER